MDKRISELPGTTPLPGDLVPIARTGVNYAVDLGAALAALTTGGGGGGGTDLTAFMQRANNLGDVLNVTTARTNIGAAGSGPVTTSGLTMSSPKLLGRTTAGTGAIEELSPDASLTLASGSLKLTSYIFAFFFTFVPTSSEVLCLHVAGVPFTIPANFSGALQSTVGTIPTASFAIDVRKNGSTIGTITVSTGGVVTATTTGGLAQSIAAGDVIKFVAPGTADATAANMAFTIIGAR